MAWGVRVSAKVISLLVQFYMIPFYIELYGASRYGEFATIISLVAILNLFDFGVSKKTMLDIADGKKGGLQAGFTSVLTLSVCGGVVLLIVLYFFHDILNISGSYYWLLVVTAVLFLLNNFFYDAFRGEQKPERASYSYLAQVLMSSVVLVVGAHLYTPLGELFFCAYVMPLLVVLCINYLYYRLGIRISLRVMKRYIDKLSLSFFVLGVLQFVNLGAGLLMVNAYLSSEHAAAYSIVHRIVGGFIFINSAMMINLPAYLARHIEVEGGHKGLRVYFFLMLLATAIGYLLVVPSGVVYLNRTDVDIDYVVLFSGFLLNIVVYASSHVIVQLNAKRIVSQQVPFVALATSINLIVIANTIENIGFGVIPLSTAITYFVFVVLPLMILLRRRMGDERAAETQ